MVKIGRPTEYKEKFIEDMAKYIEGCKDKELPSVEGFAVMLGVSKKSIYNWSKKNKEFLHALEYLKTVQCRNLMNGGLLGAYNSTIAKLILSANHNMREKSDLTTAGKELPRPIIDVIQTDNSY